MNFFRKFLLSLLILPLLCSVCQAQQKTFSAFGTVLEVNKKDMTLTQYNWNTLEVEEVKYLFEPRKIIKFKNIKNIREVKKDHEIEIEFKIGEKGEKFVTQIARDEEEVKAEMEAAEAKKEPPISELDKLTGYGIVSKKTPYHLYLSEYNLDTNELKEVKYLLVLKDIEFVNCSNINGVRIKDEIEIEYVLKKAGQVKQISKIIKNEADKPQEKKKKKAVPKKKKAAPVSDVKTGFGTITRVSDTGHLIEVEHYNWDTYDTEKIIYKCMRGRVELINLEKVTDLQKGDEIEIDYVIRQKDTYFARKITK